MNVKQSPFKLQRDSANVSASDDSFPVKAVWMPYYDLQQLLQGCNAVAFQKRISDAFLELKDMGFNTVTVQVRPCADAFYRSDYFPSSVYCFGKQGSEMPFDPLEIMCQVAKQSKLKIEAWINPYRVSQDKNTNALSEDNMAKQWLNNKKTASRVYASKTKLFFNPADKEVQKLIVNGVKEVVKNYEINAIHFDDYFYPATDKRIDSKEFQQYRKNGGKKGLDDFRRDCVSRLIKSVYAAIKRLKPNVRFGISPASDMTQDKEKLYADVLLWAKEEGYVDYLCPQVYFGFKNIVQPFMFTVKKWLYVTDCDLMIGLPLYKAGKSDPYAAKEDSDAINEFVHHDNIIARQIAYLAKIDTVKGFYIFSYGCLKEERCQKEVQQMLKAMNKTDI